MQPESAATAYRQQSIEHAPPVKLVRMLLEGGVRFLDRALECAPADPASRFLHWLRRADAVVVELRLALDPTRGAEVAALLEQLYLYVEAEIQAAQARREHGPVRNARDILERLHRSWAELELAPGAVLAPGAGQAVLEG